ncbi:restriction endonuclease [Pandoraea sputorum]|uniref:restriction endonuclease n=1 Tax=Pandoraea sputorum TaxID=93222 RepID=UPI002AF6AFEF|nr:restriction endonuclease [Pandoraea sputorum]
MTTHAAYDLLAPLDWQAFERLTIALFSEMYGSRFTRFGRAGKRQFGIDVIGRDKTGNVVAVQCKGRTKSLGQKLTTKDIDAMLKDVDQYGGALSEFHIVTTAGDDGELLEYVLNASTRRRAEGKCLVTFWAWQSLSDQIRLSPGMMRTFYGAWWTKPSLKFVASSVLFLALAVSAGVVSSRRIGDLFALKDAAKMQTVEGVQAVMHTLDDLEHRYSKCLSSMSGHAFAFSSELKAMCADAVKGPLDKLEGQTEALASVMNEDAYHEVVTAKRYLVEDYRRLLVAIDMAKFFESRAANIASTICYEKKDGREASKVDSTGDDLRRSGQDALSVQMDEYFRMRDFVMPAMSSLKARLAAVARVQRGQNIPADLAKTANALTGILHDEREFSYALPMSPFSTARVKSMSARDLKVHVPQPDPVEDAVWAQTAFAAMFEGLHGKDDEIEFLISCDVLTPQARQLKIGASKPAA